MIQPPRIHAPPLVTHLPAETWNCKPWASQKMAARDQAMPIPRKTLTALEPVTLPTELSAVSSWMAATLEANVSGKVGSREGREKKTNKLRDQTQRRGREKFSLCATTNLALSKNNEVIKRTPCNSATWSLFKKNTGCFVFVGFCHSGHCSSKHCTSRQKN